MVSDELSMSPYFSGLGAIPFDKKASWLLNDSGLVS
jgi:hypothetical protein